MEMDRMVIIPQDLNGKDAYSTDGIAELWIKLTHAADSDEDARAFLLMFEPWANERLGPVS